MGTKNMGMAAVRGRDTGLERLLRRLAMDAGLRGYRLNCSWLPGKPDMVFPGKKVAVFADGCFWHVCPHCYRAPKSSTNFWRRKAVANMDRDSSVSRELTMMGWTVVRFWEHEIRKDPEGVKKRLASCLSMGGGG